MSWIDEANSGQTMLDRALALWEAGFHIFPLGSAKTPIPQYFLDRIGDPEEAAEKWPKTPLLSWAEFQDRCPTLEEVEAWWTRWPDANIAIVTGIQIDVVDADSEEAVGWVRANLTRTPWENHTGRGVQFIYRRGELDVRNSANPNTKIDTRGIGGYIVAPGSVHYSGKVYQLVVDPGYDADDTEDLPRLTALDLARIGQYFDPPKDGEYRLSIDISNISFALTEEGVEEGGRNDKAARLAGKYLQQGDDYQTALAKLRDWNARNSPPLSDAELERTMKSVLTTHVRNHPDTYVRPVPIAISEDRKDTASIYNIGDLIDDPPEKPDYLWGGATLFRGSRMMIVGQPKAGKSRFLAALLAELAKGGTFLGDEVDRPLNTLWMNAEIHKAWLRDRMWPIIQATAPDVLPTLRRNFRLTGRLRMDITNPLHFEIIRKTVLDLDIDVIAFDPMINFSPADESNNTEVRRMLDCFDALQAETGVTIILVHHGRKGSKQFDASTFDIIRGASALRGWYDTGIIIMPVDGSPNTVTLAFELRNGAARQPITIQWRAETATYETVGGFTSGSVAPEEKASFIRTRAIAEWLGCPQLRGQWIETADIVAHFSPQFGLSEKQIQRYLADLLPKVEGIQVETSMGRKPARYRML